jgi:DNA-binding transcriptional LysR family regulator
MEWQQLEYFKIAAELEHMTLAAEELKLSQPALSRSISRLENELGVPLFEREGRSIVLNRHGRQFLNHVNHILNEYEEAKHEIQDLISPESGEVSLGFLHTLGASHIPKLIKKFSNKYPQITFKLYQNGTNVILEQLASGEIDLCMSSFTEDLPNIEWTPLWCEELFIIVPAKHRLANMEKINLEQIANESLISFKKGNGIRKISEDLFRKIGINPKITFEGEEVHTLIGLVEAGLGVAIIPYTKGIDHKKIAQLHVKSPVCQRTIGISKVNERYLSPAVIKFWQFVIEYFKE